MAFFASPFKAPVKNSRIEGFGTYTFADGNVYEGEFKDGHFHGDGTIKFVNGGKYEAAWRFGFAVRGKYTFADGLPYEAENWQHCIPADRRLYEERMNGLQPVLSSTIQTKLQKIKEDLKKEEVEKQQVAATQK